MAFKKQLYDIFNLSKFEYTPKSVQNEYNITYY